MNITPIIFIIGVMPLIVFLKVISLNDSLNNYWVDNVCYNFFSYYKAEAFILATSICLIILIINGVNFNIFKRKKLNFILIVIYSISILLSAAFSENKNVALFGFSNKDEGLFVVLSYVFIMIYCAIKIESVKSIDKVLKTLILSCVVICIIGILQYLGYDFFTSRIGKDLVSPSKYSEYIENLRNNKYVFSIYSTLGNPDNVGSYVALVFPISIIFYIKEERIFNKLVYGLINLIIFTTLLGCGSRAAAVALIIVCIIIFIFLKKEIFRNIAYIIIMLMLLFCIYLFMNYFSSYRLNEKFDILYYGSKYNIENIVLDENKIIIENNSQVIKLSFYNNSIYFKDKNEKDISININNNTVTFNDKRYEKYKFILEPEHNCIYSEIENWKATFYIKNNTFKIMGFNGKPNDVDPKKEYLFKGKERLGAGRLYIWSRTIPMLKNTLFIGYGTW